MIETARLRLIPATTALVTVEMAGPEELARSLKLHVPENWPPDLMREALPFFQEQLVRHPELVGWLTWYWIQQGQGEEATLVGCGGFKGAPRSEGAAEIGYSVLPQFQGRGYATEAVVGLIEWAFQMETVNRVLAEVRPENLPSMRVLEKIGFRRAGPGCEPGTLRWELSRTET